MNHQGDSLLNNPLLVELIAVHMDENTLESLLETSLHSVIESLLSNQDFWYRRTQTVVNFSLEWNPRENWRQVYNILSQVNGMNLFSQKDPLASNEYNLTAVKILLRLGYDPSVEHSGPLLYAAESGSSEVMNLLLSDPRIDPSIRASQIIRYAARRQDSPEMLLLVLRDSRISKNTNAILDYHRGVSQKQQDIFNKMMQESDTDTAALNNALVLASEVGSPSIVKQLLQSYGVDPNTRGGDALYTAVVYNHVEVVRVLLKDKRLVISTNKEGILDTAAEHVPRPEVPRTTVTHWLYQHGLVPGVPYTIPLPSLQASAPRGPEVMRLLLEDSRTQKATATKIRLFKESCKTGPISLVKLFLEDKKLKVGDRGDTAFKNAVNKWNIDIIKLLLEDGRADPSSKEDKALKKSIEKNDSEIISLLLQDDRVDKTGDIAFKYLESVEFWMKRWTNLKLLPLIRSRHLDLRRLSPEVMNYIISQSIEDISDSIEGCTLLSNSSGREILQTLRTRCSSFDRCHYTMLLQELILKRQDLEYYLGWILKRIKEKQTREDTRRLFSEVAKSLLSKKPIIHTSPMFTAYRGFMLLSVSENGRDILRFLSEEEATQEGLDLAGMLLGAFLGESRLGRRKKNKIIFF